MKKTIRHVNINEFINIDVTKFSKWGSKIFSGYSWNIYLFLELKLLFCYNSSVLDNLET